MQAFFVILNGRLKTIHFLARIGRNYFQPTKVYVCCRNLHLCNTRVPDRWNEVDRYCDKKNINCRIVSFKNANDNYCCDNDNYLQDLEGIV